MGEGEQGKQVRRGKRARTGQLQYSLFWGSLRSPSVPHPLNPVSLSLLYSESRGEMGIKRAGE